MTTLPSIKLSLLLPQNLVLLVYNSSPNRFVVRRCSTFYHKPDLISVKDLDHSSVPCFDNKTLELNRAPPISQTIKLDHDILTLDYSNSNLFILLKNGDLQKFIIQLDHYRNWINYPTTLVTSLIPHGWEIVCAALKTSFLPLSVHTKSSVPIGTEDLPNYPYDTSGDGVEFKGKPLVLIAIGTRRKATCEDENKSYKEETRKESKTTTYNSQLALHSFSLNDDALINSKILATEIIPCSLHFTRSYLVITPTEEHFDKLLMFRKYTTSPANQSRDSPSFGITSLAEKSMRMWSANHGVVMSSNSDLETISVQRCYMEVLDCLGSVQSMSKIVEIQTQHYNNEIFVIDGENQLYRIDLERPNQISLRSLPGSQMIAQLKDTWIQFLPYHGKQVLVSYPDLITSVVYDSEPPYSFSVKFSNPILESWVIDGLNDEMTRLLRVFQDTPTVKELAIINLDVGNRTTEKPKRRETTAEFCEEMKNVDCVVTRIGEDILKDESVVNMMRKFVHTNTGFFYETEEDNDSSLETSVQIGRNSSKCQPTIKDQVSELIFDISSNPRQRYFKLVQLSELNPEESLEALFGILGYKETPTFTLDELVILSREPLHLNLLLVQSENSIFNQSATRSKQEIILPIFEQTCRLIIKQGNGMVNGKKFVVFVSDLISKSDISLFERPTQEAMMKRFMTVWNELNHQKSKPPVEIPPVDLFLHDNMEVADMTSTLQTFFEESSLKTSTGQNLTIGDLLQKIKIDD